MNMAGKEVIGTNGCWQIRQGVGMFLGSSSLPSTASRTAAPAVMYVPACKRGRFGGGMYHPACKENKCDVGKLREIFKYLARISLYISPCLACGLHTASKLSNPSWFPQLSSNVLCRIQYREEGSLGAALSV